MLNWVKYTYGDVPIYITENGVSDRNGSLQDDHRISYYRQYINNVLKGKIALTCNFYQRKFFMYKKQGKFNLYNNVLS